MPKTLSVRGMSCGGCESNIESTIAELSGCEAVEADHEAGTVTVEGDVATADIDAAIDATPYELVE